MHKSGTSLVAAILRALGVHTGARRERNEEASFFLHLNDWLLAQSAARWDNPVPIDFMLANRDLLNSLVVPYLRISWKSPRALSYWGFRGLRLGAGTELQWGWKDPRNTFTLPLWLRLFPNAKVISVVRHGLDVASSLKARNDAQIEESKRHWAGLRRIYRVRAKRGGFSYSHRCATLSGSLGLWGLYAERIHSNSVSLGSSGLLVRYEELTSDPRAAIGSICRFLGIEPSECRLASAASLVRPAHATNPARASESARVAQDIAALLTRFGYE